MKHIYFWTYFLSILSANVFAQNFNDRFAVVSPDGKTIAFESSRNRSSHIFTVNVDGTKLHQVTQDGGHSGPNWSPNSKSLTYSQIRDRQFFDVYTHVLGELNGVLIVRDSSLNFASAWKENLIYYTSNRNKTDQLRQINIQTGKDELVMEPVEHHNGISFSPDNSLAMLVVKNEGNNWDLALFDLAKKKIVREFQHSAREDNPVWSPNANRIVFSSNRDGAWNIYTMKMDGSELINLTNGNGNSRFASWFPDGQHLIFSSDSDGNGYRIFTMNSDGSDQKELTIAAN